MLKTYNTQSDDVKDEIRTIKKSITQDFFIQMNEIRHNMANQRKEKRHDMALSMRTTNRSRLSNKIPKNK